MRLSLEERELLLRVAEQRLVVRGEALVWVEESGASVVVEGDNELLRGLWRGGYIRLPVGDGSERVALSDMGRLVVQELRVFGAPPVAVG